MGWMDKFQQGCTGVSYVAGLIGRKIEVEGCCDEHDAEYEQGGSLADKVRSDWHLAKCLYKGSSNKAVGAIRAGGALILTTFFPYAYGAWKRRS